MTKKMLIDAAQSEEIRVAVVDGKKVEDFDFESSSRKPLRGNIYLARVTRVEPSLQAAFVEYGGNRHGFLAFSEIHPDYYQIPVSDREALQAAEQEMGKYAKQLEQFQREEDDAEDALASDDEDTDNETDSDRTPDERPKRRRRSRSKSPRTRKNKETKASESEEEAKNPEENADENVQKDDTPSANDTDTPKASQESGPEGSSSEDVETSVEPDSTPQDEPDIAPRKDDNLPDDIEEEEEEEEPEEENEELTSQEEAASEQESASEDTPDIDASSDDKTDDNVIEIVDDEKEAELISDNDDDDETVEETTSEELDTEISSDNDESEERKSRRAEYAAIMDKYREARRDHNRILRNYKIQEVVKPRQILLVQVVKEERGNKGAALTSYMSLAGRYCVLMPNTARGGGISRKIPNVSDRKRLRRIVNDFDVKQGMGLIIRTAGAKRTKTEIKRDFDYLMRLWDTIRELTMKSVAPCLIYEEASLIKRAIRDLYDKDISRVLVEGEDGYREAKGFMKMLMPSHAKNIQQYKEETPLFIRYDVEQQLDMMYQPTVRLKSGGYLVIHQTEALIAVDVNSGKATRERNIETTALKTNIEAAIEVARQCKLRDLAGLIVIDFIDMEEMKNNRNVERKLKDAMKTDRARIQIGRISSFGLMEMSRQRRRSGIIDGTTNSCPTCSGSGAVRSHEMAALRILRATEAEAITGRAGIIAVKSSPEVALYILNHKREWLHRIETQYALNIEITADQQKAGDIYDIEKRGPARAMPARTTAVQADLDTSHEEDSESETNSSVDESDKEDTAPPRKRRRRRRRRGGEAHQDEARSSEAANAESDEEPSSDQISDNTSDASDEDSEEKQRKRRRRGKRGGRKRKESEDGASVSAENENLGDQDATATTSTNDSKTQSTSESEEPSSAPEQEEKPKRRTRRKRTTKTEKPTDDGAGASSKEESSPPEKAVEKSKSTKTKKTKEDTVKTATKKAATPQEAEQAAPPPEKPAKKKSSRKGWWQKAIGG